MIILLSPAKTLDSETPSRVRRGTQPRFLDQSAELVDTLKTYSPKQLSKLMNISATLGETNAERFANWAPPFDTKNARPCVQMFKGDVYTGLDADTMSRADLTFAQKHLRILSGLYGVLQPLDLIQAYRLEMGTRLRNAAGKNLYDYWGQDLTDSLNDDLASLRKPFVVNLASVEYFSSIRQQALQAPLVTPVFQDEKHGNYKIISFFAKKARGAMARYLIVNRCKRPEDLEGFGLDGYRFCAKESSEGKPVFRRSAKALEKVQAAAA